MNKLSNTKQLKALNIDKVRHSLRQHHQVTKNEMADYSGLSIATCGNILRDMVTTGEIMEVSLANSTGGRPAKTYRLNKDYHHVAAIYPRKDHGHIVLKGRITDLVGNTVKEYRETPDKLSYEDFISFIEKVLNTDDSIHVLAVGVPGVVKDGYINICDFENLSNHSLQKDLSQRDLSIIVENDVNATVLGFYQQIQENKSESTVYIYYPTSDCLGSGIIINGRLLYGKSHFAGEAGYLPLDAYSGTSEDAVNDIAHFARQAAKMLMSYICILNPNNMVISGDNIHPDVIAGIQKELDRLCAKEHQPTLFWEEDIQENYLAGLHSLAMERLSCNIVVKNKY